MGKLLEKYAAQYKGNGLLPAEQSKAVGADAFEKYETALSKGTVMECTFDFADAEGNLSLEDANGIKVILNADDFVKSAPYYRAQIKDRFLGLTIYVKVGSVDRESGIVHAVPAGTTNSIKSQVIREISAECKKREEDPSLEPLKLWGDVIVVKDRYVMVNILHKQVLGFVSISEWSQGRVRDLSLVAKPGDVIFFDVIGQRPRKPGKELAFDLSRKRYAPDPWESLPDFPEGSTMIIECVSRPRNKSYWWGQSKKTPEIDIMCDYTQKIDVMRGCTYKCKVIKYKKDKHILQAVPFEQVDVGIFNEANVAFAKGRKKENKDG